MFRQKIDLKANIEEILNLLNGWNPLYIFGVLANTSQALFIFG